MVYDSLLFHRYIRDSKNKASKVGFLEIPFVKIILLAHYVLKNKKLYNLFNSYFN